MRERWLRRLTHLQAQRPWSILLALVAVSVLSVWSASGLRVEGGFEHLLPDGRPSVAEYRRVASRTAGVSTLYIVLEVPGEGAPATDALRAASGALVDELRLLGEPYVGSAHNGVHDAVAFLEPRAGLYLDAGELDALHEDVLERWQYEVGKASGVLVDEDAPPPPLDASTLRRRLGLEEKTEKFPDGYFQAANGRALAVVVRSKVPGSDAVKGREALARIREVVERVDLASYDSRIQYGFAGNLQSGVAEVTALNDDLTHVGLLGAGLIALVVLLFYLRVRTLFVMLATLLLGIVWTAGAARFAVGTLSIGTSFVFTIIAGNGLNTSVIYMARYLELRRDGVAMEEGLFLAHRETIFAVLLVVLIAFRLSRATLYVLGSLAVGIGWMAALVVLLDIKLNFLNFVALPVTFGIGVEYAVNVMYRYTREGTRSAGKVLRETGGAVVLCSATTILGYAALTGSINGAVRSLGLVAVIGEVCTLLSAMLVLPAFLMWMDERAATSSHSARMVAKPHEESALPAVARGRLFELSPFANDWRCSGTDDDPRGG